MRGAECDDCESGDEDEAREERDVVECSAEQVVVAGVEGIAWQQQRARGHADGGDCARADQ